MHNRMQNVKLLHKKSYPLIWIPLICVIIQQAESYWHSKTNNMKLITFTVAGLFMVLSAFTIKNNHSRATQTGSLYDTKWYLTKIHSPSGTEEVIGKTAFIKFNRSTKTGGGNGSCNSFGSTATVKNNGISIKDIFSTKMYCEGVQQTEDTFFKELGVVNRFEINGKTLLLYHDKTVLLEFGKE